MTCKEKYYRLEKFIKQQNKEWAEHCKDIGFLGRVIEKIFGSAFAGKQLKEFREFYNQLEKTHEENFYYFSNN